LESQSRYVAKSAKFSTLLLDFVALNPVHKFIIGISLYRYSSNQFPNKILPIKSALASTFIYSNFQDFLLYFFAANYLFRSDPQPELADRSLMSARFVGFRQFARHRKALSTQRSVFRGPDARNTPALFLKTLIAEC